MKKYTIQETADLLKSKTHAVYADTNDFNKLRKVLKLAFPEDTTTDNFDLEAHCAYGYCYIEDGYWTNYSKFLNEIEQINLSEILNPTLSEISNIAVVDVETVTISKEDYDRFLKIEAVINQIKNI